MHATSYCNNECSLKRAQKLAQLGKAFNCYKALEKSYDSFEALEKFDTYYIGV